MRAITERQMKRKPLGTRGGLPNYGAAIHVHSPGALKMSLAYLKQGKELWLRGSIDIALKCYGIILHPGASACNVKGMDDSTYAVQRRSPRKPAQITITLVLEGEEAEQIASTVDVSDHGLRLQSQSALSPGQPVGLVLGDGPGYVLGARVVWVGKLDTDLAGQSGLEFGEPHTLPV